MNRLSPLPAGYHDLDDAEPSFDERQAPPIGETGKDEKCVVYHPTLFVWRDPTLIPRRQIPDPRFSQRPRRAGRRRQVLAIDRRGHCHGVGPRSP